MHYKSPRPEDKDELKKVISEVEDFVEWIFQHHNSGKIRKSKVIHDGVWGTNRYKAHEIALINTPLIQRLRQIHQTAFTYFIYPSTKHTRFDHTLGVTAQVYNLYHALDRKFENSGDEKQQLLNDGILTALRLAAILHDCGHGPLSHTSEEIYGGYPEIKMLQQYEPFIEASPHEILSYLIIDSIKFKEVFSKIKEEYNLTVDYDLMKNSIVGYVGEDQLDDHYKIDILNGPFDADKLDYLFRDGHFSGLPLQIDLERLWHTLDINKADGRRRLTIDWGGVSSLEQITFSKMTLFPAVYHHHKVRACDCMLKGIIEYILANDIVINEIEEPKALDINLSRAVNFLYLTDNDIFSLNGLYKDHEKLHSLIHNLEYRRLLKRVVVISRDTVEDKESIDNYYKFSEEKAEIDGLDFYRGLAKQIWEKAGTPGLHQELWVDCPKHPSFGEVSDTWVSPLGEGQASMPLSDFFKAERYAAQYKLKKWRSHVFCKYDAIEKVAEATVDIFREKFGIEFKRLAFDLCHVTPPKNLG